jgi:A/G-specific adenine glycosylase
MDFAKGLKDWYQEHRRDLPWRRTTEPYKIWLSEVILQQTRIEHGIRYYRAFLERFPSVHHLAEASEEEVLKMWQGLGYYTRARNLHHTARYISRERAGEFPEEFDSIRGLKGVGPYTAAAIASFCFGQRTPVVDGNVERVLARLEGIEEPVNSNSGKKRIREIASEKIDPEDPATFNQAIMEFGAIHCTPRTPACGTCPFQDDCTAFQKGKVEELPVKRKGKAPRDRYFNYLYLRNENGIVLEQRRERDIWQHLYQFPLIESKELLDGKGLRDRHLPDPPFGSSKGPLRLELEAEYRHTLSHQRIHARFWRVPLPEKGWPEEWVQVREEDLEHYAFPRPIERFLS